MDTFIIYLAKTGICLGIFLIIYHLFLRSTTFFRFNRIFLLSGIFISLAIAATNITYDVAIPNYLLAAETSENGVKSFGENVSNVSFNIWIILSIIYFAGILIILGRNLYASRKLITLIKGGVKIDKEKYKIIDNKEVKSPFTILNYILLNTSKLSEREKDLILKHELTHITQKHWVDLICCECLLILQWFNPIAWIYVSLLKENHEFLADKAVIDSGISPAIYQAVLINLRFEGPVFSFTNSFNYSKPLNRLSMIKQERSAAWKKALALIIAPILGMYLWVSATPNYIIEKNDKPSLEEISNAQDAIYIPKDSIKKEIKISTITVNQGNTIIKDSIKTIISTFSDNPNIKKSEITVRGYGKLDGDSLSKTTIIVNGKEIKDINELDNDLAGRIKTIRKKVDENMKDIATTITIISDKKGDQISDVQESMMPIVRTEKMIFTKSEKKLPEGVLFIVDGKEIDAETFSKIDIKDIESLSVLKDDSATKEYGEKGKNGVIIIETKK